jgi:hypothetical protein
MTTVITTHLFTYSCPSVSQTLMNHFLGFRDAKSMRVYEWTTDDGHQVMAVTNMTFWIR